MHWSYCICFGIAGLSCQKNREKKAEKYCCVLYTVNSAFVLMNALGAWYGGDIWFRQSLKDNYFMTDGILDKTGHGMNVKLCHDVFSVRIHSAR